MKMVIIGASAAGIAAAETLRGLDASCEITVVSKDDRVHSRCMIHHIIDGGRTVQSLNFAGAGFFDRNKIQWVKGKAVTAVNPAAKEITLDGGGRLGYDKLLIAAGAVSFVPPVPGLRDCKQVYCLRDLEDAEAIRKAVEAGAKNIVVMGAGLVGLDAVSALINMNVNISVIEMADRVLPLQLDETASALYREKFEEKGVKFLLGKKLANVVIDGGKNLQAVELSDGASLPCDIIVAASGVRANVAFMEGSGVKAENGVTVDGGMHTSEKDIFAAGDVTGLSGTWGAAVKQGRTAARNMINDGSSLYLDRYNMKNTMNFFDIPALSVGRVTPQEDGAEIMLRQRAGAYQKLIVKDGAVTGALFVGDIGNRGHWQYIVKNGLPLTGLNKPPLDVSYSDFYEIAEDGQFWYAE